MKHPPSSYNAIFGLVDMGPQTRTMAPRIYVLVQFVYDIDPRLVQYEIAVMPFGKPIQLLRHPSTMLTDTALVDHKYKIAISDFVFTKPKLFGAIYKWE